MPSIRCLLLFAGICLNSAVCAMTMPPDGATIWGPTEDNTNYTLLGTPTASTINFALYDYDDVTQGIDSDTFLPFMAGDQIHFFRRDKVYFARNDTNPGYPELQLGNNRLFVIGANDGSGWVLDDGAPTLFGTNTYALKFVFASGGNAMLLQTDAKIAGRLTNAVPTPGTALLMFSGLMMLARWGKFLPRQPSL